jgi:hypothetical protein
LKHKRRKSQNPPAVDIPAPVELAELIETSEDLETEKIVAAAVEKAVEIADDDALAIRRLRASLIEKLFTPERTFNSWTELKATN